VTRVAAPLKNEDPERKNPGAMPTLEEISQTRFDEDDKRWTGPRFISLGVVTLTIAISLIYLMSLTGGCSLQIVP
jgi:hypothetical protein